MHDRSLSHHCLDFLNSEIESGDGVIRGLLNMGSESSATNPECIWKLPENRIIYASSAVRGSRHGAFSVNEFKRDFSTTDR
jgi:hypothetical protein